MNKTFLGYLAFVIGALICLVGAEIFRNYGVNVDYPCIIFVFIFLMFAAVLFANPTIRQYVYYVCCKTDWADNLIKTYKNIDVVYRKSFWIVLGAVNLAFLFHTVNFMWGGGDWLAIRNGVDIGAGLQEGRFSAYWMQNVLFDGKILPVLNNLCAFVGLSLAGILLSVYWKLPKNVAVFVLVALFFAVNPYVLAWLYFAKNTLGNLWLPAIVLCALILADKKANSLNGNYIYNLVSIFLLVFALGTYLPIVNFIVVALIGKIVLLKIRNEQDVILSSVQSFANLTAAFMLYAFVVVLLKDKGIMTDAYNTKLEPVLLMIYKLPYWLMIAIEQFFVPVPFIGVGYKILYLFIVIMAIFVVIFKCENIRDSLLALLLLLGAVLGSKLTYLISVQSYDNLPHLVRIDFYGLPILYALMLAILLVACSVGWKKFVYLLAGIAVFASFVQVAYALKVWKFGFDAETKLAERIITRLEKLPEFDIEKKYKLIQIGEMSLRKNYYTRVYDDFYSGEMLEDAYYQQGNAKDAYNFFYQVDFLSEDAAEDALENPLIKEYLRDKAQPWPANGSVGIVGEYIIIVL